MGTEANNPKTRGISEKTVTEILRLIHEEDKNAYEAIGNAMDDLSRASEILLKSIQNRGRVIYAGAGTSGRIAVQDLVELEPTYGIGASEFVYLMAGGVDALVRSQEGAEDNTELAVREFLDLNPGRSDSVVGISASGNTPFVVAVLEEASRNGLSTIGIVNNTNTRIHEVADLTIVLETGAEVIQGSSRMKAGTAQKMALNMISTAIAIKLGKTYDNMMSHMGVKYNAKLLHRALKMLMDEFSISEEEAAAVLQKSNYRLWRAIELLRK